jgi:4'-phosphopantetheinyl transferase
VDWPTTTLDLAQVHLEGFDAGPGLVGTLASVGATTPRVELRRET